VPVNRLFIAILMLSVFGYGTVWAFDSHAVDLADHAHATENADPDDQAHDESGCDHCCHAGAHFTGLTSADYLFFPPASGSNNATIPAVYVTRATDPPLKPPQS